MALSQNDAALRGANVLTMITQYVVVVYSVAVGNDVNMAATLIGIAMSTIPIFYTTYKSSHTWVGWMLWALVMVMVVIGHIVRYPERWIYQGMTIFYHFEHS